MQPCDAFVFSFSFSLTYSLNSSTHSFTYPHLRQVLYIDILGWHQHILFFFMLASVYSEEYSTFPCSMSSPCEHLSHKMWQNIKWARMLSNMAWLRWVCCIRTNPLKRVDPRELSWCLTFTESRLAFEILRRQLD